MKKYQAHKSSLFLIELILAIAFFALASAVCLQLFVKSHTISHETAQLNTAVNLASSAAECFRTGDGDPNVLLSLMPELESGSDTASFIAFYNAEGRACEEADAVYILTMMITESFETQSGAAPDNKNTSEPALISAEIKVLLAEDDSPVYELPVQIHLPYTY